MPFAYSPLAKIRLHCRLSSGHILTLYLKLTYGIKRAQTIYFCEFVFPFPLAKNKINARISDRVCDVVADRFQCGISWRTLAGDLWPKIKADEIKAIEEDRERCPKECCRAVLQKWSQKYTRSATSKELMRCLTNMGLANVNWQIMKELGLVNLENIPLSER